MFSGPFVLIVGAVIVALGVVLAIVIATGGGGGSSSAQVERLEEHSASLPLDMVEGTKVGRDDAPVKVTVFADFQCPHCLNFTADQEGEVVERFVKSGDMQLEYRHLSILGSESVDAALASQCAADQDKFWQYHNKLFLVQAEANQSSVPRHNVGRYSADNLKKYASELGLDTGAFNTCFDTQAHLDTISNDERTARSFGISGTPGFLVNGQPLGSGTPSNIESWQDLMDQVKNAQSTVTPETTGTPGSEQTPEATATP